MKAQLEKSIRSADFIAIDTEFSGCKQANDDRPHDYDTIESRYQKMRLICSRFFAFQFGICTFKWDEDKRKYVARPYVLYLFPKSTVFD